MSKQNYVMSPSELKTIKDERKFTENMLRDVDSESYGKGSAGSQMDKEALRRMATRYAKQEDMYTPKALRGANKDKVAKECQKLESEFTKGMLTKEETRDVASVYKHLAWEKKNSSAIQKWKQLQRRLEPGDPSASNIERLRREK